MLVTTGEPVTRRFRRALANCKQRAVCPTSTAPPPSFAINSNSNHRAVDWWNWVDRSNHNCFRRLRSHAGPHDQGDAQDRQHSAGLFQNLRHLSAPRCRGYTSTHHGRSTSRGSVRDYQPQRGRSVSPVVSVACSCSSGTRTGG